jgi:hypothetical protein
VKAADRHHPADDRLVALYYGDHDTETEEQRGVRQHVHGCETCTWRYTELVAPLGQLRADAATEADEIFTPARLDAQRQAIRERLGEGVRSTRVIPFPAGPARVDRAVMARPMFRWVAAAAAAGLLVGVSAGRFLAPRPSWTKAPAPLVAEAPVRPDTLPPRATPATYRPVESDEAFMNEVETAVSRQRIAALSALDDLTPHAREAVLASAGR